MQKTFGIRQQKYCNHYAGGMYQGQPNGFGMVFEEKYEFVCEFQNGRASGYGLKLCSNGDMLEGEFTRGLLNGAGRIVYGDGR